MSGCQLAAKVVVLGPDWFGDQAVPVSVVISYAVGGVVTIILIFRSGKAV